MRVRKASSYSRRVDMGTIRKPENESNKATLARIMKEMAKPRISKSARKQS
jgi:histone H3/H4